ncbi:MAG: hypothetical protein F4Z26_04840 [Acidimicrobiaceae bacterium]|nr:hypothetical protein [Acidimicrobiaceae bacterium]
MGGTDSLSQAESFLASAGGPPIMLWDERPDSWSHYNAGNPALILLDGAGETRVERVGSFNRSRLQDALDSLS